MKVFCYIFFLCFFLVVSVSLKHFRVFIHCRRFLFGSSEDAVFWSGERRQGGTPMLLFGCFCFVVAYSGGGGGVLFRWIGYMVHTRDAFFFFNGYGRLHVGDGAVLCAD